MSDRSRASGLGLFRHPAQYVVGAFLLATGLGTLLLSLPVAQAGPGRAPVPDALFTATSAVCVTGLAVVDTASYWSPFGEAVILALIQVGGFGIMTLSSAIAVVFVRRLGLRRRLGTAAESRSMALGDVRRLLVGVARFSLAVEPARPSSSPCASGSPRASRSGGPPTWACSRPSRPSTTPASPSSATATPRGWKSPAPRDDPGFGTCTPS